MFALCLLDFFGVFRQVLEQHWLRLQYFYPRYCEKSAGAKRGLAKTHGNDAAFGDVASVR